MASSIVAVAAFPMNGLPQPEADVADLLDSFVFSGLVETAALAWAMLPMVEDPDSVEHLRAELGDPSSWPRGPYRPDWLAEFPEMRVARAAEVVDRMGDGDQVVLELRWPSGAACCIVCYVDHNLRSAIKDAFFVPADLDSVLQRLGDMAVESGMVEAQRMGEISPADACERLVVGVGEWEMMDGAPRSEGVPGLIPFLHWCLSTVRERGTGYPQDSPPDEVLDALVERFAMSAFASSLTMPRDIVNEVARAVFDFISGQGWGDPLMIGAVSVEVALMDWFPYESQLSRPAEAHVPEILAAVVRFAHAEIGLPENLTNEVIESVDRFKGIYLELVSEPVGDPAPPE